MNRLPTDARVIVAGARGMVGSAIQRKLASQGLSVIPLTRKDGDFCDPKSVAKAMAAHEGVNALVIAAARVGGIRANDTYPAEFIYENLMIEANLIHAAWLCRIPRLIFLGSSCIYPKLAPQPMAEEALLTGALEPTNEPYAIAKIAGIKLCESFHRQYGSDFRSLMPTNLYGPNDNFTGEDSHVIPALMRKFADSVQAGRSHVEIWGTGNARREFLHVDDLADAVSHVLNLTPKQYWSAVHPQQSHINIGTGEDVSIRELAEMLKRISGFGGELRFDDTRPDGTPRKLLDVSKATGLGWKARTPLHAGLAETYDWYLDARRTASSALRT